VPKEELVPWEEPEQRETEEHLDHPAAPEVLAALEMTVLLDPQEPLEAEEALALLELTAAPVKMEPPE